MAFSAPQPLGAFGNYRLIRRIARGGMAEIFLALLVGKAGFEKVVVLKRVLPELAEVDDFMHIFLDEARLAARLDHPNVGRVYELGEVNGQYYLAMEYLPGEDLASVIQQCRRANKTPSIEVAAEIALGICDALHFAHSAADGTGKPLGIVHRDVSPSNVVATYQGQVKLIDFGIARATSNIIRTGGNRPKGKVQYMSPEQAAGKAIDRRSDVFSAGVVLHELLTTQRLFRRNTDDETLQAVLGADAPAPSKLRPDVPPALDRICARALAKDPAARFQTAEEMAAELRKITAGKSAGGAQRVGAFMVALFPADRREKKLKVSQGMIVGNDGADITPVLGFDGFTPIRTDPMGVAKTPATPAAKKEGSPPAPPPPAPVPPPPAPMPPKVAPLPPAVGSLLDPVPLGDDDDEAPPSKLPRKPAPTADGNAAPSPSIIVDPSLAKKPNELPEVPIDLGPDAPARPPTAVIPGRRSSRSSIPAAAAATASDARPKVMLGGAALAVAAVAFGAGWLAHPNAPRRTEVVKIVAPAPAPAKSSDPTPPPVEQPGFSVGAIRFEPLPPGAKVTLDGDLLAHAEGDRFLSPGSHKVQISVPGFYPYEQQVELTAGQTQTVAARLEKLPASKGTVEVVCTPWCEIEVDGKPGGYSPARLSLTVGTHKLRAGSPQLGVAKEVEVRVDANSTQKLELKLAN